LNDTALLRNGFHDLSVDSVEDTRNTAHESGLEALHVIHKFEWVTTVVSSLETLEEREDEDVLLEGVPIGKIRNDRVILVQVELEKLYQMHASQERRVAKHSTLGVTSGS
jgi:hypothetical protein